MSEKRKLFVAYHESRHALVGGPDAPIRTLVQKISKSFPAVRLAVLTFLHPSEGAVWSQAFIPVAYDCKTRWGVALGGRFCPRKIVLTARTETSPTGASQTTLNRWPRVAPSDG